MVFTQSSTLKCTCRHLGFNVFVNLVHAKKKSIKDRLQSLLCIRPAHNKCGPHCPNFAFLKTFSN